MTDYTTKDAVDFALNNKNADFKTAISDLLMDKVRDAIDIKRIDVASNLLNAEAEVEPELEIEIDDIETEEGSDD